MATEWFCQSDEKSSGTANVAKPIRVLVLNHFANELRTLFAESAERFVNVAYCEHSTQVAEGIHRGIPVIGDYRRGDETRELKAAVAVGSDHHGDLDALITQSSDASGPLSFDYGPPLKRQAKFCEKRDGVIERVYHGADIVHS
jgi:hypothetical protein